MLNHNQPINKKWQGYIGKPPVKNYQEDIQVPVTVYANYR